MALWERGETVGQITVAHELERQGRLEEAGGLSWLSDLILDLPTPVGCEHFAAIVRRDAMYRKMISASMNMAQIAYQAGPDYEKALAKAEQLVYALREEVKVKGGFSHIRDLLGAYMDVPEETPDARPRALNAVQTGIHALDAILQGIKQGYLVVIAAQTSIGKTSLMCNLATNVAVAQGGIVALFTLEMPEEQIARRILAGYARVDIGNIERRFYTEDEMNRIMHGTGVLSECSLYLYTLTNATVADIESRCRELARDKGLDLVIIDYLGKITTKGYGNRNDLVGQQTKALSDMALLLDVPVILGSQLRRLEPEGRRPTLSDLRDSGNIEQDATVVVFIHREDFRVTRKQWEQQHPDVIGEPYPQGQAELIVAKNRNGPTGTATVRYRSRYTKFEDFDLPAAVPVQGGIPDFLRSDAAVGYH
jgi:replicative DNA helicase